MPTQTPRPFYFLLIFLLAVATGCSRTPGDGSTCAACHQGLELASETHMECVSCHGGDPDESNEKASHRNMYGPKNPADPKHWDKTCGNCHPYQLDRVRANLMYTNTGMIKNAQATWEGEDGTLYATRQEQVATATGEQLELKSVAELDNLAGELYRKTCSLCHIGVDSNQVWTGSHASGCGACHFPYNDNATYQGQDPTVKGKWPHSASHKMETLPDNKVCVRCHNRSGRIALSYEGRNDGNNSLVPTRNGEPGPDIISGVRNATRIQPDIHHEKGLECIDCHTSRDIMGDGYAYENMYQQTEITCEDCHGSISERPRVEQISRENDEVLRESAHYKKRMKQGDSMVLTSKDRKYSNVFLEEEKIWVQAKRTGKLHESKVITGTPEHSIIGHERMECYACHSRTVVQCYGCHTEYDQQKLGTDYIKGVKTPGQFTETEDYRMIYPFPLALNQRGKISSVTPGCQTFVSVIDPQGEKILDEYITIFKGKQQLRFAPFFGHNTGTKAIGCSECHANPAFLGFGQHVVENDSIEATLICEKSEEKPLDGFITMNYGEVKAFSAITRENSRPFVTNEVQKIMAVNLCLVCHNDPKDPIYQKELDYNALDDCLQRSNSAVQ
ncbi:MAG: selenite/tellurite reduction operon c-type cytochrome ExtM [Deltaproteobacteria bacterium]|nr:selenite/tellurite reduction operon c-type cytochrome ExtM [Deltaproteobacteria bacterium]